MDMKLKSMLILAKAIVPPLPKDLSVIQNPKFELSRTIISTLNEYREKLKSESNDLYEIVMKLSIHFIITYETDEKMKKSIDLSIDKIIEEYLKRKENQKLS